MCFSFVAATEDVSFAAAEDMMSNVATEDVCFEWLRDHFGIILGSICDHFGVRSSLGRQVTLEAELWGHNKFCKKNKQIS